MECHHRIEFITSPPTLGELIWCARCQLVRMVTVAPAEYRISCTSCSYGRRFGEDYKTAERKAAEHSMKKDHDIKIMNGTEEVAIRKSMKKYYQPGSTLF